MTWVHLIKSVDNKGKSMTQDLFRHLRTHGGQTKKQAIHQFCKEVYPFLMLWLILTCICGFIIAMLIWWK
tara:strand:+ start:811 stop:1020 length:210 start_codon:yes stop_codon:yes gene_type:complete